MSINSRSSSIDRSRSSFDLSLAQWTSIECKMPLISLIAVNANKNDPSPSEAIFEMKNDSYAKCMYCKQQAKLYPNAFFVSNGNLQISIDFCFQCEKKFV